MGLKSPAPLLNEADQNHRAWQAVREYIEERIKAMRIENDDINRNPDETASLRGGILELKKLLARAEGSSSGGRRSRESVVTGIISTIENQ